MPHQTHRLRRTDVVPETDVESRPEALEAKEELRAFIADYCRACDSMSGDAVAAMFTADAVLHNAVGDHTGRDAIRAYYAAFYDGRSPSPGTTP